MVIWKGFRITYKDVIFEYSHGIVAKQRQINVIKPTRTIFKVPIIQYRGPLKITFQNTHSCF